AARILAVGPLAPAMGHDCLLRATQLLVARGAGVTLEILGDGPERDRLRALAAALGIAGRTHFHRPACPATARRAVADATILVHPSDGAEPELPDPVPEAM